MYYYYYLNSLEGFGFTPHETKPSLVLDRSRCSGLFALDAALHTHAFDPYLASLATSGEGEGATKSELNTPPPAAAPQRAPQRAPDRAERGCLREWLCELDFKFDAHASAACGATMYTLRHHLKAAEGSAREGGEFVLYTVTFHANPAHALTCPPHIL